MPFSTMSINWHVYLLRSSMQSEVARSLSLIRSLLSSDQEKLAQIDKLIAECDPSLLEVAEPRPLQVDPENAALNAHAEADYLVSYLQTRYDLVSRLAPTSDKKNGRPLQKSEPVYCVCKRPAFGDMVACDAPDCPYEWYHWDCVGLKAAPKGKWLCSICRKRFGLRK